MAKKILLGILLNFLIILLAFTACNANPATSGSTQGNWWDTLGVPKYGGTITTSIANLYELNLDLTAPMPSMPYWAETLFGPDMTQDPSKVAYSVLYKPLDQFHGVLAESWERTDPLTLTVHIRQGIHWQNKPPVNGREFTAEDVEFNYDMIMGTGNGFTTPKPFYAGLSNLIEKATATDKYTVVFKLKQPSIWAAFAVIDPTTMSTHVNMMAPEQVKAGIDNPGIFTDWHNAIGTGPWLLSDALPQSHVVLDKNPDYYGRDQRYPQNRLPYIDSFKVLAIKDPATALAALRTGRVDVVNGGLSLPQTVKLADTNPDIHQYKNTWHGETIDIRCDREPFTDIRVRKALQMAIDIKAIAKSIYAGTVDGVTTGLISPLYKGYTIPFAEWPKDLQSEYSYNPTKAKALLTEAGFPNGFKTNIVVSPLPPIDLITAIKGYFQEINVDMEIIQMDVPTSIAYLQAGKNDQLGEFFGATGMPITPLEALRRHTSKDVNNFTHNNDSHYEALVDQVANATNDDELKKACVEADMYNIAQHWTVQVCPINNYTYVQPWIKGGANGMSATSYYLARWWIEPELKK